MPNLSSSKLLMPLSPLNFFPSKKKSKLIRFSEQWMRMEMVSFKRMRSRKDTLNSSEEISPIKKLMIYLPRLMLMDQVRLSTLSLSQLPSMKRISCPTISSRLLSRCLIKMVVAPFPFKRSKKSSHLAKILMKKLFSRSSSKLMQTAMEKFLMKNSLK